MPSGINIAQLSISGLDDGPQFSLSKFADSTRPTGVADRAEGDAAIQRHLDRLEKQGDGYLMKFSKEKCKVLQL